MAQKTKVASRKGKKSKDDEKEERRREEQPLPALRHDLRTPLALAAVEVDGPFFLEVPFWKPKQSFLEVPFWKPKPKQ